jgi:hypothetical protein
MGVVSDAAYHCIIIHFSNYLTITKFHIITIVPCRQYVPLSYPTSIQHIIVSFDSDYALDCISLVALSFKELR